jgi:glycosyltransferase involved in cell wall biosynthesis
MIAGGYNLGHMVASGSPRSVLFFLSTLGGGGAEAHTLRVLNHLPRERWRPSLAVARRAGNYEKFLADDVAVHAVSYNDVPSAAGRMALAIPGLRRLIRRERPDVVCAVMEKAALVAITTMATLRAPRPRLLLCIQAPPLSKYRGDGLAQTLVLPSIRWAYPRADGIVALSRGVRDELARIQPRLAGKTTVIYNAGVDERILAALDDRRPADMPETDLPVVITAGRLSNEKNHELLVDAFARVRATLPCELWILGEGSERAALEARVRSLGLEGSVRLLGFRPDPAAFMRRATLFVLSSRHEGFGNVIVEAQACGTPVVSTDCPYGPGEIITHERDGLLVPVDDRDALAAAMTRVLGDDQLRRRLAEGGRARAAAFHAEVIARAYADELERVTANGARSVTAS